MTSNTTPTSLAACPFCGCLNAEVEQAITGALSVVCGDDDCVGAGPVRDTEAEAITAWNRRASLTPATDERLAELLGEIRAEQVQLAMLVGSIKMEWASSGHWSEWDQQRQNSVHAFIAKIDTALANREQSK